MHGGGYAALGKLTFMRTSIRTLALVTALLGLAAVGSALDKDEAPSVQLTRSHEHRIKSTKVGDDFVIWVRLPESYEKRQMCYPVVYVLDADVWFGFATDIADNLPAAKETPEVIVVGIAYGTTLADWEQKRVRDYTPKARFPETTAKIPLSGGADKFQEFLVSEVFPLIERNYAACADDRTLIGLSFGGAFAVHTLFTRPELFQRYIILAPSLAWDKKRLFETEEAFYARKVPIPAVVFFSVGDKDGKNMVANWREFDERIKSRGYEKLCWSSHLFPDETHLSVYPVGLTRGLKDVFVGDKAVGVEQSKP